MCHYVHNSVALLSLCACVSVAPLKAQTVPAGTAPDTTILGAGFTVGGFGYSTVHGLFLGADVRFLPLNSWFSMDLRTDFGLGAPSEGRDIPKSFQGLVCLNAYVPLTLRWAGKNQDGVLRYNAIKPYGSLGFGFTRFGGFTIDAEERFSRAGGGEVNLAFGFEFRFHDKVIFCLEPMRWHKLSADHPSGYNSVKLGFIWIGKIIQQQTN